MPTEVFSADVKVDLKGVPQATDQLENLRKIADETLVSLGRLDKVKFAFGRSATAATANLEKNFDNVQQSAKQVGQATQQAGTKISTSVNKANKELSSQVQHFHDVRNAGVDAPTTISERWRGASLVLGQSGARMQGLREVLSGTTKTTNSFVQVLDRFAKRGNEVARLNTRLAQGIDQIAAAADKSNRSLKSQSVAFNQVAKAELGNTNTLRELNAQLTRVDASFKQVRTTAAAGGDTTRALNRTRVEVEGLETEFKQLIHSGIIPAQSESADLFRLMISQAKNSETRLSALGARQGALKDNIKKATVAQREQSKAAAAQASVFKRLSVSIGSFFNVFRSNRTTLNQTNQSLRETSTQVSKLGGISKLAGAAFLGAFGGAAIFGALQGLRTLIRGIASEFFALNDVIQNTNITIQNMLLGSQVNAEEAIAGFTQFVEEQVAETPFEFADAIDNALRLTQQGFDPKLWFRPAANAAAAMNKPMEQFVGGLIKLVSGARGAAVEMFRDFGLNVNNISGTFDKATGRALTFEEVQGKLGLSQEEFAARTRTASFEFDKQGSLITDTGESLEILNAFLSQNATFAKAAEARSQSLTGVISNLKDAFSKILIALGQPIFEKLTTGATGLLSAVDTLLPRFVFFATSLGTSIGVGINFVVNAFGQIQEAINTTGSVLNLMVSVFSSIIQGDWGGAWESAIALVSEATVSILEVVNGLIESGFEWGFAFMAQLGQGIIAAGQQVLNAVIEIASQIASFFAPGSPPKEGPLSEIDKWGAELMNTFLQGTTAANVNILTKALEPVASLFGKAGDSFGGAINFKEVKADFIQLSATAQETGEINERLLGQIKQRIRATSRSKDVTKEETEALIKQLDAQLGLSKANGEIARIKEEIVAAEKEGFIPAELKAKLKSAQDAAKAVENEIKLQEALKKLADLDTKAAPKNEKSKLKAKKAALAGGAGAAAKAAKKELKSFRDSYSDQLKALEIKNELGIADEEEFLKQRLRLEKKFVDDLIKEDAVGNAALIAERAAVIADIETRLEKFKKTSSESLKAAFTPPTVEEIFANFAADAPVLLESVGEESGEGFVAGIKTEFKTGVAQALGQLKTSFLTGISGIFKTLKDRFAGLITSKNLPIISVVVGFLLKLTSPAILGGLSRIAGLFFSMGGGLAKLLLTLGKFTLIGAVVTILILNWERIVPLAIAAWETLTELFDDFIERAGGIEKVKDTLTALAEDIKQAALDIGSGIAKASIAIATGLDFSSAGAALSSAFSGVNFSAIGNSILALLQPLGETIGAFIIGLVPSGVLDAISLQFQKLSTSLGAFFAQGRLGGELLALFESLGELFTVLWPPILLTIQLLGVAIGVVIGIIFSFVSAFVDALPLIERALAGVVKVVTGVIDVITALSLIVQAAMALISGDSATASAMFQQAMTNLGQAIGNIATGIWQTVTSVGLALVTFAGSFVVTMVALALSFIPGFETAGEQLFILKDHMVESVVALADEVIAILVNLSNQLATIFSLLGPIVVEALSSFWDGVVGFFNDIWDFLVRESIIPDMIVDILSSFSFLVTEGLAILGGLVSGVVELFSGIAGTIVDLISGLFSGGDEAGGGLGSTLGLLFDPATVVTALTAVQGILEGFLTSAGTGIAAISSKWTLLAGAIQTQWDLAMVTISLALQTFLATYNLVVTSLVMAWQTYVTNKKMQFISAIEEITPVMEEFGELVKQILLEIIALLNEISEAFEKIGEDALEAGKSINKGMKDAKKGLELLLPLIARAITRFEELARAARLSAQAIRDAGKRNQERGGESFQHGTMFVPKTGTAFLHRGEAVLSPDVANRFRGFIQALNARGLGDKNFDLPVPNRGGAGLNTGRLDASNAGGLIQNNEFNTQIFDPVTDAQFRDKVLKIVTGDFPAR